MKTKAFLFDLDGVIVDTAKYHFLAWQKLANELGIEFTEHDNEQLKGVSRVRSLELILALGQRTATAAEMQLWLTQKNDDYLGYIQNMQADEILPGVIELLDYLKTNKQKIALGSASKNARLILDKVNLTSYFDAIIDGNSVSNAKPDPEVFLQGAKAVEIAATDTIVFEDAAAGIEAANAAKMYSIGIGDPSVLGAAKLVVPNLTAIGFDQIDALIAH